MTRGFLDHMRIVPEAMRWLTSRGKLCTRSLSGANRLEYRLGLKAE